MSDVGGPSRNPDGEERQQGSDQIGAGVQRLGDQAEAVRRKPDAQFQREERRGRDDRDERGSALRSHLD